MSRSGIASWMRHWWDRIVGEMTKFGIIGLVGLFIDNGAYWFLRFGWFGPSNGLLFDHPKIASFSGSAIATLCSWIANRSWTYRDRPRANIVREGALFAFINLIGALIPVVLVSFTIDVLDMPGIGPETLARNIGIVIGTLLRFWFYRTFVFTDVTRLAPARRGG